MLLVEKFQERQSVAQLTLIIAALVRYRRIYPDSLDGSDKPITGSYITDLDAFLRGSSLGNSGKVAERMAFALSRTLQSLGEESEELARGYRDLATFLEITLDREHPSLHFFDGLSDGYMRLKVKRLLHETAIMKLADLRVPEFRGKDNTRVNTAQLEGP